jgi:hypothetical protein
MSDPLSSYTEDEILAIGGMLASGVAGELARPLRQLREMLAKVVDSLDQHVANAKGPTPFPWKQVGELRDHVAEAYLLSRTLARLSGDLANAVSPGPTLQAAVEVNRVAEAALNLARHRVASDTELFIDLGALPTVRAVPGHLLLGMARVLLVAAASARGAAGTAISVKTRRVIDRDAGRDQVVISVAENGGGDARAVERCLVLVRQLLQPDGAEVIAQTEAGSGSTFEIRLPVGR